MTVICAIMGDDGHVTIGCDGRFTYPDGKINNTGKPKIIKIKSEGSISEKWFIGFSGYSRAIQIIENQLTLNLNDNPYSISEKIKEVLHKNGHSQINDNMNEGESTFIICKKNLMFNIQSDYGYDIPVNNFISIGSSKIIAISSFNTLKLSKSKASPESSMKIILRACEICDSSIGPMFHIFNTKPRSKEKSYLHNI